MPKQIKCPGCDTKFKPGRSYTQHANSCKDLETASERALQNHKIALAKKAEDKKSEITRRKELKLAAQELQNAPAPMDQIDNDQNMEVDLEMNADILPPPKSPSPPPVRASGRPGRHIRMPLRYRDVMPANPPIIPIPDLEPEEPTEEELEEDILPAQLSKSSLFCTETNSFGIYRRYTHGAPTITPDGYFTLSSVSDSVSLARDPAESLPKASWQSSLGSSSVKSVENATNTTYAPFLSASVFLLMAWFYNGSSTKSFADVDKLVHDVIQNEDFKASDFDKTFSTAREAERIDKHKANELGSSSTTSDDAVPLSPEDGWIKGSVSIPVPCDGFKYKSEADAPRFTLHGVWYRRPLEVLKMAFSEPAAAKFITTPYKEYCKPSKSEPEERIYGETYSADVFHEEYDKLRSNPRTGPNSHLEPFVAGISFYSDATHLASFGDASLWPLYMYITNQSKYIRAQPGEFAAHHIAYIPKLGDEIHDWYFKTFGKVPTAAMLTHLRRELIQAIWLLLLDDEMMHAYEEGEAIKLFDDNLRAMFPRFIFYSMDYPEKVLMSCIKFLGKCMCPRCLSLKEMVRLVGSKSDMRNRVKHARVDSEHRQFDIETARRLLFQRGLSLTSKAVKAVLDSTSAVPTRNAFSLRLFKYDFNFYRLYTVDFLHEIEIGDWKALFIHLLRILYAHGQDSIQSLNSRYRQISSFGRSTIRKFGKNASGMKKLAARDFEDLLQCALPVFEDLLPQKHDRIIQQLIFEMASWHALAKLRLHTDSTLGDFENASTQLCDLLRKFQKEVCSEYITRDLPSEEAARGRRKAAKAKKAAEAPGQPPVNTEKPKPSKKSKIRRYNMSTYKLHSIPDYVPAIRAFGTIDNTSSQNGECEHKRSKQFYPRVRKGDHVRGIARHVFRERTLFRAQRAMGKKLRKGKSTLNIPFDDEEVLDPTPPEVHHHISKDLRHKVDVPKWLAENREDRALVNFLPRLKDHLLARLINSDNLDTPFTDKERSTISLLNNRIYRHKVLRINYTTYDMRRAQDSLNPRTHGDIMVLSHEEDPKNAHPYWYARIIGIFHAMVTHKDENSRWSEPKKMEFLFVRWFGLDTDEPGGWKARRLHQIGFLHGNDPSAFGFLDPADVIRAVHLIPRFSLGRTSHLMGPSIARSILDKDEDWDRFYINMFVDRDMVMRFRGGGIGHASTRAATDKFKNDRHAIDIDLRDSRQKQHAEAQEEDEQDADIADEHDQGADDEDLSESELLDYGYEDPEEEDEDDEQGEDDEDEHEEDEGTFEDGTGGQEFVEDLATLGYAEY